MMTHPRRRSNRTAARRAIAGWIVGVVLLVFVVGCTAEPSNDTTAPVGGTSITVTVIGDGRATFAAAGFTCRGTCTLFVDEGTEVILAAAPEGPNVLVAWDGPCAPFGDTCAWRADADASVRVTFARHALRFDLAGDGEGSFEINVAGDVTECREACGVPLTQPLAVTITYVSGGATRTTLGTWVGACADETATYCLVNVAGTVTVGMTWRHPPRAADHVYTTNQAALLDVVAPGVLAGVDDTPGDTHTATRGSGPEHGDLTLSPDGSFTYEPHAGFSGTDAFTFRVTDAFGNSDEGTATVTVRPRLDLAKEGAGSVTSEPAGIDCDPSCTSDSAYYEPGASVTLTATADPGHTFEGWTGDACDGSNDPICVVTMDEAVRVAATFSVTTYTLDVARDGSGNGNVTSEPSGIDLDDDRSSATFEHGTEVTLTARPAGNSEFTAWSTGPCEGSDEATCTFVMSDDTSVTATFTRRRLVFGSTGRTNEHLARHPFAPAGAVAPNGARTMGRPRA